MHRRTFGPIATVLILLPMLAMPVLATIGIPSVIPWLASLAESQREADRSSAQASDDPTTSQNAALTAELGAPADFDSFATATQHSQLLDPFRQTESPSQADRNQIRRVSHADHAGPTADGALEGWRIQPPQQTGIQHVSWESEREVFPADPRDSLSRSQVQQNAQTAEPLTWQAAVRRLNSLGIRQFNLQEGVRTDEFHFSCFYTPPENPRIRHRFEAEARDPLRAVEKVFAQISEWQRFRQY